MINYYNTEHKLLLTAHCQYCIANYNLNDNANTNLKGNYLTTKLISGNGY